MTHDLNAGFTGTPHEKSSGIGATARTAADMARSEARAVAVGAADHPHTATTLVLALGALTFALGYAIGRSHAPQPRHRLWR